VEEVLTKDYSYSNMATYIRASTRIFVSTEMSNSHSSFNNNPPDESSEHKHPRKKNERGFLSNLRTRKG